MRRSSQTHLVLQAMRGEPAAPGCYSAEDRGDGENSTPISVLGRGEQAPLSVIAACSFQLYPPADYHLPDRQRHADKDDHRRDYLARKNKHAPHVSHLPLLTASFRSL